MRFAKGLITGGALGAAMAVMMSNRANSSTRKEITITNKGATEGLADSTDIQVE